MRHAKAPNAEYSSDTGCVVTTLTQFTRIVPLKFLLVLVVSLARKVLVLINIPECNVSGWRLNLLYIEMIFTKERRCIL
jgi:hypothetical protein